MTGVTDEGMMRAACVMREAADRMVTAAASLDQPLALLRLAEIAQQFENAVERLVMDMPTIGD